MKELTQEHLEQVNGGFLVSLAVLAVASYATGYAIGAMTKEEKPEPKPQACEPNPYTGSQCA